MGNLSIEIEENYERLSENAIDIAEIMLDSCEEEVFEDMLQEEFDIFIDKDHVGELLSRCHSAVTEEIYKFVKEIIGGKDNGIHSNSEADTEV